MSDRDAINAYHLFLGRQPESERVVSEKAALPIHRLAAIFLGSREFSERILPPLIKGYPLPHFRVGLMPHAEIVDWVRDSFPLSEGGGDAIGGRTTWRQILRTVLTATEARKLAPPALAGTLAELASRDDNSPENFEREVVGSIDDFSTFEIRGWAADLLRPEEPLTLEVFFDNMFVGIAQTGLFRREVQEKVGGSGKAGFLFNIPAAHHPLLETERLLTVRESISGRPVATPIRVRGRQAGAFDSLFHLRREIDLVAASLERIKAALPSLAAESEFPIAMYDAYQKASRVALMNNRHRQAAEIAAFSSFPAFSVVLTGAGDVANMMHSVNSIRRQTYRNWECIICVPPADPEYHASVSGLCAADTRIKSLDCAPNEAMWKTANDGGAKATGDYLLWLREGDLLSEDTCFELAKRLQEDAPALIYFDEDRFERQSGRPKYTAPVLKTAFDHDHLLACNYIENAFACRRSAFEELGGFRGDFEGAHEYDLLLRAVEASGLGGAAHLSKILYHRRDVAGEAGEGEAAAAAVACVNAHLARIGANAAAEAHADPFGVPRPKSQRIVWRLPAPAPKVSIVIPTRDRADLLKPCVESIFRSQESYPLPFEIVVMDNDSCEPETTAVFEQVIRNSGRVIASPGPFNWSAINNRAAAEATGDILLFLNNDTRVLSSDWVRELASIASRPEVGAVGARLLYEDGTIQHAGVVLGGRAVHEATGQRPADGGYLGRTALQRNVSAVTGACLATRRQLFLDLGGFDELNLKVAFNDVDYCLKVRAAGLSVIYTPFATLYHLESKSRGLDDDFSKRLRTQNEVRVMRSRWGAAMEHDPFYNTRFNRTGLPFTRLRPPQIIAAAADLADDEQELWEVE